MEVSSTSASVMDISTNCPLPVLSLAINAAKIPIAADIPPAAKSAIIAPGIIGAPPTGPVIPNRPPIDM